MLKVGFDVTLRKLTREEEKCCFPNFISNLNAYIGRLLLLLSMYCRAMEHCKIFSQDLLLSISLIDLSIILNSS